MGPFVASRFVLQSTYTHIGGSKRFDLTDMGRKGLAERKDQYAGAERWWRVIKMNDGSVRGWIFRNTRRTPNGILAGMKLPRKVAEQLYAIAIMHSITKEEGP